MPQPRRFAATTGEAGAAPASPPVAPEDHQQPQPQSQQQEYLFRHLDLKWMKEHADELATSIRARKIEGAADIHRTVALHDRFVRLAFDIQQMRAQRNRLTDELKQLKKNASKSKVVSGGGDDDEVARLVGQGKELREQLHAAEKEVKDVEAELYREAKRIPNVCHPAVPHGSEDQARVVCYGGPDKKQNAADFGFEPVNHVALCQRLDLVRA
jgi:seryl-tRNA synthetase